MVDRLIMLSSREARELAALSEGRESFTYVAHLARDPRFAVGEADDSSAVKIYWPD